MTQDFEAALHESAWAILPSEWARIARAVKDHAAGQHVAASGRGRTAGASQQIKGVALVNMFGVIQQHRSWIMDFFGGVSTEAVGAEIREAALDPSVRAIVLNINSPGGGVQGVPELAREILNARAKKQVTAVANSMAASAAYWLASQASDLVISPSGSVGSIGVFASHEDYSKALDAEGVKVSLVSAGKYKTEGNPYEPLGEEARANLQADVDAFYGMFVRAVAVGRRVTNAEVLQNYGQGRMLLANQAVRLGMADRVDTLDGVIRQSLRIPAPRGARAILSRAALQDELRRLDTI